MDYLNLKHTQTYFWRLLLALFLPGGCVQAQTAAGEKVETMIAIQNPGFEDGVTGWSVRAGTADVAGGVAHSGNYSLHYLNTDSKRYALFTQRLNAKPGQILLFSAWVKGENVGIKKRSQGAGVFVQSCAADGQYINGSFPRTLTGTFDWSPVNGEYIVPSNAVNVSLGLYLRRDMTGEAWFDDVEVQLGEPVEFTSFLKFPNYRGMIEKNDDTPWQVGLEINVQPEWAERQIHITTSLTKPSGKVLSIQNNVASPTERKASFTFKRPDDLPLGDYILKLQVTNPNDQMSLDQEFPIRVVNSMPKVYIDSQGFTVVNGKRFFPLGAYTGSHGSTGGYQTNSKEVDLKRMSDAGLNTVLSYSYATSPGINGNEFLDIAEKNHLHVIYSVKDMYDGHSHYPRNGVTGEAAAVKQINLVKNHPALLAWYTNDEMRGDWLKATQTRYNLIENLDVNHPTYIVSNSSDDVDKYYPMTDVIGMDPYPIGYPGKKLDFATDWAKKVVKASRNTKGVWEVVQIFNLVFANHSDRTPSVREMRNMSYQAMINGAKGLIYYAYHWLFFDLDESGKQFYSQAAFEKRWPDVRKVIQEVKPLTKVILKNEKVDLKALAPSTAQYQAWQYDGKLFIMIVNATDEKTESLQLQIPIGWQLTDNNISGVQTRLKNNVLQIQLAPVASGTIVLSHENTLGSCILNISNGKHDFSTCGL